MPARKPVPKADQNKVSAKIRHLIKKEGVSQKQAVATAINMNAKNRLGPKGGYKAAPKPKKKA